MFQQLNEFKYTATTGKTYIVYFLKFWHASDKKNDYIVKYQIRGPERDFVWYGRISKGRFFTDHKNADRDSKKHSEIELEDEIKIYLKKLFIYILKKALDKGFEEPNTEFVFYKKPPIVKRTWSE
ncbi:hypothetical protein AMJ52_03600 [candidate division TA06 bacterium DG_78]|uniref:Uncharacterized protein n=1 Tax=candidate division TA06 bacterium DG_78 TaxID=1703772 RepID=A0A0S7YFQ1_UNCT6|nr:MAG: hypothetical protein AMJ52_03600 [candidate division TA06 bacterium DG_78]